MHTRLSALLGFCAATMIGPVLCLANEAVNSNAPAPSTGPAAAVEQMKIIIAEVKGLVQVRVDENAAWQAAKVGMELDAGAEFRTGPRSSVLCQIPPDQTLILDRLGTVKIAEAIKSGNKIKTDMIMKYGRTSYDIETAGAEHESTIRSPSSTLAVRGTSVSLYDQPPFMPEADSFHGRALYRTGQKKSYFGGKKFTSIAANSSNAADSAISKTVVDPVSSLTLTSSEQRYIANETSRGAILNFDSTANIPFVKDGPGPDSDATLASLAGPGLDVFLRWNGNANLNMVVDLEAGDQAKVLSNFNPNQFLYPGFNLNHLPNGGFIPYDDRGGPRGGQEAAFFPNPPVGVYGVSAIFVSGSPVDLTFNAYLNGKPLDLLAFQVDSAGNFVTDANGNFVLVKNTQIVRPTSSSNNDVSAIFFAPANPGLESHAIPEPPLTLDPLPGTTGQQATAKQKTASHASVASHSKLSPPARSSTVKVAVMPTFHAVSVSSPRGR